MVDSDGDAELDEPFNEKLREYEARQTLFGARPPTPEPIDDAEEQDSEREQTEAALAESRRALVEQRREQDLPAGLNPPCASSRLAAARESRKPLPGFGQK